MDNPPNAEQVGVLQSHRQMHVGQFLPARCLLQWLSPSTRERLPSETVAKWRGDSGTRSEMIVQEGVVADTAVPPREELAK